LQKKAGGNLQALFFNLLKRLNVSGVTKKVSLKRVKQVLMFKNGFLKTGFEKKIIKDRYEGCRKTKK